MHHVERVVLLVLVQLVHLVGGTKVLGVENKCWCLSASPARSLSRQDGLAGGRGAPPGARAGSCRAAVRPPVNFRSQNDREAAIQSQAWSTLVRRNDDLNLDWEYL